MHVLVIVDGNARHLASVAFAEHGNTMRDCGKAKPCQRVEAILMF